MKKGHFEDKEGGVIMRGIYMPLTSIPIIGNFNNFPGLSDDYMESNKLGHIKEDIFKLLTELEDNDPELLKLMDYNELKDIEEVTFGIYSKIIEFKRKARLQMKAKLLFEEELKDPEFTEEELIELLEFTPEIDKKKITIENIIKYYPNLIIDNINKIKDYKNAKKKSNSGSCDTSSCSE